MGEWRSGGGEGRRSWWQRYICCEKFELSLWLDLYLWGDQHIFWSEAAVCDALCIEVGQCLEQLAGQSGEGLRARGQKETNMARFRITLKQEETLWVGCGRP